MAIEAGLQAEEYGYTPAEIMGAAPDMGMAERFWFNAQVRAATADFKEQKHDEAMDAADSPGAASPQQKREMHERQKNRAKNREEMQKAGMNAPTPDGQLQRLQEVQKEEEQAESVLSDQSGGEE